MARRRDRRDVGSTRLYPNVASDTRADVAVRRLPRGVSVPQVVVGGDGRVTRVLSLNPFTGEQTPAPGDLSLGGVSVVLGAAGGSEGFSVPRPVLRSVSVSPAGVDLNPGGVTQQFVATGTFDDGTTGDVTARVTWFSSDYAVLSITSGGLATTGIAGGADVTAFDAATGVQGKAHVNVQVSLPNGFLFSLDATTPPAADGALVPTWGAASQPSPSVQPFWDSLNLGDAAAVVFGGGPRQVFGSSINTTITPTYMGLPTQEMSLPGSLLMVFRCDAGQPSNVLHSTLVELSADISSHVGVAINSSQTSAGGVPSIQITGPSGAMTIDVSMPVGWGAQWIEDNLPRALLVVCDGTKAGTTVSLNGVPLTVTKSGTDPGTGSIATVGTIGAKHDGTSRSCMALGNITWWNRALSSQDQGFALGYASSKWALATRNPSSQQIAIDNAGDSIMIYNTFGCYPAKVAAAFGARYWNQAHGTGDDVYGIFTAQPGAQLSGNSATKILDEWNALVSSLQTGVRHVVFNDGGTNDIQNAAAPIGRPTDDASAVTSAATILTYMQQLVTKQISDLTATGPGPHDIYVQTVTYGVDNQGTFPVYETCRQALNALYRTTFGNNAFGNSTVRTHVLDFDTDPFLGTVAKHVGSLPNDYFCDTLHPTYALIERMGALARLQMVSDGVVLPAIPAPQIAPMTLFPQQNVLIDLFADLGIKLNGSTVKEWDDQSGYGFLFLQPTGADQPTYVSSGATQYLQWSNNASQILVGPNLQLTTDHEIFIGFRSDGATASQNNLIDFGSLNNLVYQDAFGTVIKNYPSGAAIAVPPGDHVLNVQNTGNTLLVLDGATSAAGSSPYNAFGGLTHIGQGWNGRIYCVIIINFILSSSQRAAVLATIRSWGTAHGITFP